MNTELRNHHKHAIHQTILECCADLLDEDDIVRHQLMLGIEDPISREESELHIRMADAAYAEYEKTMFPDEIQSCGLLPSELLKQRDEMIKMISRLVGVLTDIDSTLFEHNHKVEGWHLNGDLEPMMNFVADFDMDVIPEAVKLLNETESTEVKH